MEKLRAKHLEGSPELVSSLTERMTRQGMVETSLTIAAHEPWPAEGDVFVLHAENTPPMFGWVRTVQSLKRDAKARTEVLQLTIGRRLKPLSPLLVPGGKIA